MLLPGKALGRIAPLVWPLVLASAALGADTAPASAQPPAKQRPAYVFLRQNEDWSVLGGEDPLPRTDDFDAIKYVPLVAGGSNWASFGGSARARSEFWQNFGFGAPAIADDAFGLWRLLLHADFHVRRRARFFVELKSALASGRELPGGERTIDVDTFDLQQGFVDLALLDGKSTSIVARVGRQELLFGKQRLVSPLPWGNTLRTWDGGGLTARSGHWKVDGFWTRPVPVNKTDFNQWDDQSSFYGAYATRVGARTALDLYLLGIQHDTPVDYNGTVGPESRYTAGARVNVGMARGRLHVEVEAAQQLGEVGQGHVDARMLAVVADWRVGGGPRAPLIKAGFDVATGDDSPGGNVGTFNQLYPLGHAYFGIMDFIGRQNIVAASAAVGIRPLSRLHLTISGHLFRRQQTEDAVYNAGGVVVVPGDAGSSHDIGSELDLVAAIPVDAHLLLEVGLARLFAGELIEQAGDPSSDMNFAYLQLVFRF